MKFEICLEFSFKALLGVKGLLEVSLANIEVILIVITYMHSVIVLVISNNSFTDYSVNCTPLLKRLISYSGNIVI